MNSNIKQDISIISNDLEILSDINEIYIQPLIFGS